MKNFYKNKVVIITGSSSGIGKLTAFKLAKLGAKVVINGRNIEKLIQTKAEFNNNGCDVLAIQADVADFEDCKRLTDEVIEKWERIDVLICNSGITMKSEFDKMNFSAYKEVIDVNLYGAVIPVKLSLPFLKISGGKIILISSLAGLYGLPEASGYSMGKMSLTAFFQSMRLELIGSNVNISIIYVGFTENEPSKRALNSKGAPVPIAHRPSWVQQSREKVADSVIKMIKRRKSKIILSGLGKVHAFIVRFSPFLLFIAYKVSRSRNNK